MDCRRTARDTAKWCKLFFGLMRFMAGDGKNGQVKGDESMVCFDGRSRR